MEKLLAGLRVAWKVFTPAAFSCLSASPLVYVVTNLIEKGGRVVESNLPTNTMFGLFLLLENIEP